jgi:hypothetical protein
MQTSNCNKSSGWFLVVSTSIVKQSGAANPVNLSARPRRGPRQYKKSVSHDKIGPINPDDRYALKAEKASFIFREFKEKS